MVAPLATPVTTRGIEGVQAPVVGRERELALVREVAGAALAGTGAIVFITGEPGIGKTRLLAEFRELFDEGPAPRGRPRWLEGRCVSYGESMPYWPFRDLVRSWLGVLADEPELRVRVALRRNVERLFGDRAAEITPYLAAMLGLALEPDAQARLGELSPEALQYRTFEVVRHWLQRLAEDGPVAVALEDLHWADATSLQLLERLLPDTETSALLLVLTLRQERDHPAWRLKEDAARELPHRTTEIALEALSGDAGLDLLRSLVGEGTLPEDMERRILEHAEGNPFFLEELVRSLADAGALVRDGDGWRFDHDVEVEIPPTVEKVILARIDRLEPQPHTVLMAASVLGRQFGLPLLEAVSGGRRRPPVALDLDAPRPPPRGAPVARARVPVQARADPGGRVPHARRRRAPRRPREGRDVARGALRGPRGGGRGPARAPLARRRRRGQGGRLPDDGRRPRAAGVRARRGDRALPRAAPDPRERGEQDAIALVLFKLALALHMSLRFAEANEMYQRAFDLWRWPEPTAEPAHRDPPRGDELPPERPRPSVGDRVAEHPALHAAVRPPRRGVAGADDRAVARRAMGDLRRRPPLRLPSPGGPDVVGRRAAHRARRRVRDQAGVEPRRPGIVGRDLLRARARAGPLPAPRPRTRT